MFLASYSSSFGDFAPTNKQTQPKTIPSLLAELALTYTVHAVGDVNTLY